MIDVEAILSPIPGENPAGEDLRYTPIYDQVKEARRADDPLNQGDWQRELKTSDWDKVIALSVSALTEKSKDLQIAAWLTEALTEKYGFEGFTRGMEVFFGLMEKFWDRVYPEIDEDDFDFRAAPLEFLNNTLWIIMKRIPLTDVKITPGYSWIRWEESRQVGFEETTRNPEARNEMIAEGKISGEVFDAAVARSSRTFYEDLAATIQQAAGVFASLDNMVDEKFGRNAPKLSDLGNAISDCEKLVSTILREKRASEPDTGKAVPSGPEKKPATDDASIPAFPTDASDAPAPRPSPTALNDLNPPVRRLSDTAATEEALWEDALSILEKSGIKAAVNILMAASYSAPSVREKNRCRLLMARLCLKADRHDLARPIIESLYALIEELALEKWESPLWIGEVIDVLYQCLTAGAPSSEDGYKATSLLVKLATIDVTKALKYRL